MAEQMVQPLADPAFPPSLAEVSESERAPETFGWLAALVGAAVLVLAGVFGFEARRHSGFGVAAVAGLFGLLLIAYEVYRRRAAAVLVRRDGRIGLYRRGTLAASFSLSQVTRYYLRHGNTFQHLVLPGMLTAASVMIAMGSAKKPGEPTALLASLAGALAIASIVRTRVFCHHYRVPKGKRSEQIILSSADSERLFQTSAQTAPV